MQFDVFEVGLSVDVLRIGVNVPLGHVVVTITGPVLVMTEIAQFLPENIEGKKKLNNTKTTLIISC